MKKATLNKKNHVILWIRTLFNNTIEKDIEL